MTDQEHDEIRKLLMAKLPHKLPCNQDPAARRAAFFAARLAQAKRVADQARRDEAARQFRLRQFRQEAAERAARWEEA